MIISKATSGYCVIDDYTNFNSFFCRDYAEAFRTSKAVKKELSRIHDMGKGRDRFYDSFWAKAPSKRQARMIRMFHALIAQGK